MSRQIPGDISVWTVGGTALLDYIHNVSYTATVDTVEGRSIAYLGRSARAVKKGAQIRTGVMSSSGNTCQNRVTNLNVSAITIDAVSYATMLRGGRFSGEFTVAEASAVGDLWHYPYITAKDYTVECELMIPLSATANAERLISLDVHSTDPEDLCMVFSITINSIAYTLPMMVTSWELTFNDNDIVIAKVTLKGKGPDSDTGYPTAPTGTTSLLEKAFNDPLTALAFTFTPNPSTTYGIQYTGNVIFGGFSFSFNDAQIIDIDYTFLSQGTVTQTNLS